MLDGSLCKPCSASQYLSSAGLNPDVARFHHGHFQLMQNLIALAPIPEVADFPLNFSFDESVGLPLDGSDFHPGADLPRTGGALESDRRNRPGGTERHPLPR